MKVYIEYIMYAKTSPRILAMGTYVHVSEVGDDPFYTPDNPIIDALDAAREEIMALESHDVSYDSYGLIPQGKAYVHLSSIVFA